MVWRNAGGICERKPLFRMKKEADQAGFKGTRTGRSRALKPGICFFFHPEQCFSLTNSSSIPLNHPNSSRIPPILL